MVVNPLHLSNAELPMEVTVLGMTVFLHPIINLFETVSMMALQSSLESKMVLPDSTIICSNAVHSRKALLPIEVTEFGMVIEVRLLQ